MQTLMSLLSKKYKYHLRYSQAVQVISDHWRVLVNELADQIQPVNIYKNQLVVECKNPMWLSEIDYFSQNILDKVHQLFIKKNITLRLVSIKPVYNASMVNRIDEFKSTLPETIEERILVSIENKKSNGAILCESCKKVWDKSKVCRLCQLTS